MWGRYYHLTRFRSHICTANFAAIHRHLHWIRQRRRQRSPSDRLWLCNATAAPHDVRTHCSSRQTHFAFSFLAPCHGRLGRHYSGSSHRYFGLRWFDLTFVVTASIRWFWLYNITFLPERHTFRSRRKASFWENRWASPGKSKEDFQLSRLGNRDCYML